LGVPDKAAVIAGGVRGPAWHRGNYVPTAALSAFCS
jgi:hypothetical protein